MVMFVNSLHGSYILTSSVNPETGVTTQRLSSFCNVCAVMQNLWGSPVCMCSMCTLCDSYMKSAMFCSLRLTQ